MFQDGLACRDNAKFCAARIAAIELAAGASRRMGTNKLLLTFEGELAGQACRQCLSALRLQLGFATELLERPVRDSGNLGFVCIFEPTHQKIGIVGLKLQRK